MTDAISAQYLRRVARLSSLSAPQTWRYNDRHGLDQLLISFIREACITDSLKSRYFIFLKEKRHIFVLLCRPHFYAWKYTRDVLRNFWQILLMTIMF